MKSAPFDYYRARTVDEVCRVLAESDGEARIIAGGQSLVPLMATRLARPDRLVDINAVDELDGIARDGDALVIGAMTRQRTAERDPLVAAHCPLLARALCHVGHVQTRNRGTVGGSLCQADPAAEIPLAAVTLEATLHLASRRGPRRVAAGDFATAALTTVCADDECLTAVSFPVWTETAVGCAFHEVSMRHGDFAMVAAAAQLALDADGRCRRLRLGLGGVAATAVAIPAVADALVGTGLTEADIAAAVPAIDQGIDPDDDVHASAGYRRRVARRLAARAIADAADEARARLEAGPP